MQLAHVTRRVAQIFLFRLSGDLPHRETGGLVLRSRAKEESRNPGFVVIWAPASAGETDQLKLSGLSRHSIRFSTRKIQKNLKKTLQKWYFYI